MHPAEALKVETGVTGGEEKEKRGEEEDGETSVWLPVSAYGSEECSKVVTCGEGWHPCPWGRENLGFLPSLLLT